MLKLSPPVAPPPTCLSFFWKKIHKFENSHTNSKKKRRNVMHVFQKVEENSTLLSQIETLNSDKQSAVIFEQGTVLLPQSDICGFLTIQLVRRAKEVFFFVDRKW